MCDAPPPPPSQQQPRPVTANVVITLGNMPRMQNLMASSGPVKAFGIMVSLVSTALAEQELLPNEKSVDFNPRTPLCKLVTCVMPKKNEKKDVDALVSQLPLSPEDRELCREEATRQLGRAMVVLKVVAANALTGACR